MPSLQPDPSQFTLREVTDLDTVHYTRRQNAASWKGQLSEQDYVTRELVLGKAKIAANLLKVFVLTAADDDEPLLSVELLIRPAWKYVYDNGHSVRKDVLSGCIGGVFTYPQNRGKGIGKIMIDKLVVAAKESYLGPDGYLFLYSEIGDYYAKNGFRSCGVDIMNIPVGNETSLVPYELLKYHTFAPILDKYAVEVDAQLADKTAHDKKTRVLTVPSGDLVDWFHIRSKYIAFKLHHEKSEEPFDFHRATYEEIVQKFTTFEPHHFGLKIENKGSIIWTYDWTNKTENYVTVLKIVVDPTAANHDSVAIDLLQSLRHHLVSSLPDQTTSKIIVWESEVSACVKQFLVQKWNTKAGIENSSRSAINLCNEKEQNLLITGDLVWEENNKLPWF